MEPIIISLIINKIVLSLLIKVNNSKYKIMKSIQMQVLQVTLDLKNGRIKRIKKDKEVIEIEILQ